MVLNRLLPLAMFVAWSSGCASGPEESPDNKAIARSQSPLPPANPLVIPVDDPSRPPAPVVVLPPTTAPVTRIEPMPDVGPLRGETQVRIVATIGTTPIYDLEVREAVYQRSSELLSLPSYERKAKEKEMYNQELKRVIERELILEEMLAKLKSQKRTAQIEELKKISAKDADTRMSDIRKKMQKPTDEEFKSFLNSQGITVEGLRRHFERGTMMNIFLSELIKTKIKNISLADLKDYYDEHSDDYRTTDRVKWQDLFVRKDRFKSIDDASRYAAILADRARKGEDFVKMVEALDQGDSKWRHGAGNGEEKGTIFPPEVEPTVFALKKGEVAVVEIESGYHVIRLAERTYAGKRLFTEEKLQQEIRRKVEGILGEREYRHIVESLWTKNPPTIFLEGAK